MFEKINHFTLVILILLFEIRNGASVRLTRSAHTINCSNDFAVTIDSKDFPDGSSNVRYIVSSLCTIIVDFHSCSRSSKSCEWFHAEKSLVNTGRI